MVSFQRNEHNVLWNNIRKLWSHVAFKHILLQHTLRHGQGRTILYLHMSCYYVHNCILWCLSSIHCFLFVVMTFQGCCINTYTIFVIQLIEIVLKCIFLKPMFLFWVFFIYIFNVWALYLLYTRMLQECSEKNVWKIKHCKCISLKFPFLLLIVIHLFSKTRIKRWKLLISPSLPIIMAQ